MLTNINSNIHQCIIVECIEWFDITNHATFDDKEYELRVILCVHQDDVSTTKYNGIFFMRHGGDHSNWWCQKRNNEKNIAVQLPGFPEVDTSQYSKSISVYVQSNHTSLKTYGNDILKFIGG